MSDGTFEISLFRRLHVKDWLDYPGQLSFRCYIIVMSTTWRTGIHHKLFGNAGCVAQPLPLNNGHLNVSLRNGERTCWQTPREGSRVTYACQPQYEMMGPDTFVCQNGSWQPSQLLQRSTTTMIPTVRQSHYQPVRIKPPQRPYCSEFAGCCCFLKSASTHLFSLHL